MGNKGTQDQCGLQQTGAALEANERAIAKVRIYLSVSFYLSMATSHSIYIDYSANQNDFTSSVLRSLLIGR